jgi:hypothetical protein
LAAEFGRDQVFRDIDTLQPGEDFVEKINEVVGECDVFIAVIGPHWTRVTGKKGTRRLENPMDFVRLEIAAALKRNTRVIPVLVGDAEMPSAEELPDDLAMLTRRHAVEISDVRFRADVNHLIAKIRPLLRPVAPESDRGAEPGDRKATVPLAPDRPPPSSPERAEETTTTEGTKELLSQPVAPQKTVGLATLVGVHGSRTDWTRWFGFLVALGISQVGWLYISSGYVPYRLVYCLAMALLVKASFRRYQTTSPLLSLSRCR